MFPLPHQIAKKKTDEVFQQFVKRQEDERYADSKSPTSASGSGQAKIGGEKVEDQEEVEEEEDAEEEEEDDEEEENEDAEEARLTKLIDDCDEDDDDKGEQLICWTKQKPWFFYLQMFDFMRSWTAFIVEIFLFHQFVPRNRFGE